MKAEVKKQKNIIPLCVWLANDITFLKISSSDIIKRCIKFEYKYMRHRQRHYICIWSLFEFSFSVDEDFIWELTMIPKFTRKILIKSSRNVSKDKTTLLNINTWSFLIFHLFSVFSFAKLMINYSLKMNIKFFFVSLYA